MTNNFYAPQGEIKYTKFIVYARALSKHADDIELSEELKHMDAVNKVLTEYHAEYGKRLYINVYWQDEKSWWDEDELEDGWEDYANWKRN